MEYDVTEDEAIAALLHDAVEDQGGKPTLEEIRRRFGDQVGKTCVGTAIKGVAIKWVIRS